MQRATNIDREVTSAQRRRGRSGWIAFAVGMLAMFVLLGVWIVLVEMGGSAASEAVPSAKRPASTITTQDACADSAISDCR